MNKYKNLIEKFEDETELPATWSAGFLGGYTREYTEWLAEVVVKNCSIPDVSVSFTDRLFKIAYDYESSVSERMEQIKTLLVNER